MHQRLIAIVIFNDPRTGKSKLRAKDSTNHIYVHISYLRHLSRWLLLGDRNKVISAIARNGGREWKRQSGHHQLSFLDNPMYRLKRLTGDRLWARQVTAQATEVASHVGELIRMPVPAHARTDARVRLCWVPSSVTTTILA
jgi:hypothetical protein